MLPKSQIIEQDRVQKQSPAFITLASNTLHTLTSMYIFDTLVLTKSFLTKRTNAKQLGKKSLPNGAETPGYTSGRKIINHLLTSLKGKI